MKRLFFSTKETPALAYAISELERTGTAFAEHPSEAVTHLLLSAPCRLRSQELNDILGQLPPDITVVGGSLDRPELDHYRCIDLLKDEQYQAENAMITAYCAVQLAANTLPVTWQDCPILILGWGRIGKCLTQLLDTLGATISVAARKETDRAMITALGYHAQDMQNQASYLSQYRLIFNTAPAPVLSREDTALCRKDCVKIELASRPGIAADDVIDGRGLPGKLAPESAGKLMARTALRLCVQKEGTL